MLFLPSMFEPKKQKLLVIAPHPDDEVLGCGGLVKKIKDAGGKVYVLFLTVGDTRDFSKKGLSTGKERKREIEKVAKLLKIDNYHLVFEGDDYHLKLDLVGQKTLMGIIERESVVSIEKVKPTIVAYPSPSSYNQDHRIARIATHAALRPSATSDKHFVQMVLSYEEPADIWRLQNQPEPNLLVPLTKNEFNSKLAALKLYRSQLRPFPNPRSAKAIKALAMLRGSQCGQEFAEGFRLYRAIFD